MKADRFFLGRCTAGPVRRQRRRWCRRCSSTRCNWWPTCCARGTLRNWWPGRGGWCCACGCTSSTCTRRTRPGRWTIRTGRWPTSAASTTSRSWAWSATPSTPAIRWPPSWRCRWPTSATSCRSGAPADRNCSPNWWLLTATSRCRRDFSFIFIFIFFSFPTGSIQISPLELLEWIGFLKSMCQNHKETCPVLLKGNPQICYKLRCVLI